MKLNVLKARMTGMILFLAKDLTMGYLSKKRLYLAQMGHNGLISKRLAFWLKRFNQRPTSSPPTTLNIQISPWRVLKRVLMLMKLAIKVQNQFQSLKDLEIETRVRKGWKIIKQNQKHEPSTRSNLNHKYLKRAQKNSFYNIIIDIRRN